MFTTPITGRMTGRTAGRFLAGAAVLPLAAGALLLGAAPASAHVTLTPTSTAAGASSVLSFSVGHGCAGSPTTRIAIQVPEEITSVTPTRNPLWDVDVEMEKLDEPVADSHGNEVTERVSEVVYTAKTPLPDGERDTFDLSLTLPDAEGETLAFPTVQNCTKGQTAWTEVAADGQDGHDLESPAPLVTITGSEDDGHGHGTSETSGDSGAADSADSADAGDSGDSAGEADESEGGNGLAVAGLVAGILGLLAGGAALANSRRAR